MSSHEGFFLMEGVLLLLFLLAVGIVASTYTTTPKETDHE